MSLTFDFDKLVLESIEQVHAYKQSTGELLFLMDEIKNGTITSGSEIVYAQGKNGVNLAAFDRNKTAGFSCSNGYVVASALAYQYGSAVEKASATNKFTIREVEYITVGAVADTVNTTITLSYTPTATSPKFIYAANSDMSQGTQYARVASSATAEQFTITGSVITLPTGGAWTADSVVIVPYDREVTVGKRIKNEADKFPDEFKLVVDILASDPCAGGSKYLVQLIGEKAKSTASVELAIGDNVAEHALDIQFMSNPCNTDKTYFTVVCAE